MCCVFALELHYLSLGVCQGDSHSRHLGLTSGREISDGERKLFQKCFWTTMPFLAWPSCEVAQNARDRGVLWSTTHWNKGAEWKCSFFGRAVQRGGPLESCRCMLLLCGTRPTHAAIIVRGNRTGPCRQWRLFFWCASACVCSVVCVVQHGPNWHAVSLYSSKQSFLTSQRAQIVDDPSCLSCLASYVTTLQEYVVSPHNEHTFSQQ